MCCDQSQQNPSMQESHKSTSQLRLSDLQFSFYATPDWLLLTTQHSINIILPSWCVCLCVFFFFFVGGRVDECKKSHVRNGHGFAAPFILMVTQTELSAMLAT